MHLWRCRVSDIRSTGDQWTTHQAYQVRVLLFGWPLWTADPDRAQEAFDTMPTGHPDGALAAIRAVDEWFRTGVPHHRVLAYIEAGVTIDEASRFEADPAIDTTQDAFAEGLRMLAAFQPPRPLRDP
jgi:hypothetical protein